MNFQRSISNFLVRSLRAAGKIPFLGNAIVRASFDAVRQTWGERSWMFQSLQDAWIEYGRLERYELQRIHGGLVENSWIVRKIRSLFLQFSVGASGLICTPNASTMDSKPGANSEDEKTAVENWNHLRAQSWARWFRCPELNSNLSGGQLTRVWAGLLFDTGEIFVNFTTDAAPGVSRGGIPKFQTIDSQRCETPADKKEHHGNPIIDGREMTVDGKTVAYWFRKTNFESMLTGNFASQQLYDRIEVYDPRNWKRGGIVHKYKVRRPGQLRGIPEGVGAYNIIRDNMDLFKLEMQAAKLAAEIANVETNSTGELDTTTNRQARTNILSQTQSGGYASKNIGVDYKVSFGAKNIALHQGDSIKQFMIDRPSVAQQEFYDLHFTAICADYEIPKMLVMPYSLQGTVTRADLDVCGYGFAQSNFEIIQEVLTDGYEWQSMWARDYDRTMDGEWPADFTAVFIRPPRKPNVDIGYTARALETELRLGTKTLPDVYAEKQQDFRTKLREIAESQRYITDLAAEFGIEASQITSLAVSESMLAETAAENRRGNGEKEETGAEATAKQVVHA
jgi:capsid protein